jgi:hypothetical protein
VSADAGGVAPASDAIQSCISSTPTGGTLELPAGIYRVTSTIHLDQPITLRTAGTAGDTHSCLGYDGLPCVVLRADDALQVPERGFVRFGATHDVTLDHVVIDGNRDLRLQSASAQQCASGTNFPGFNAGSADSGCTSCAFVYSGSARAVCGTGLEWNGDGLTVSSSVFRDNGDHATPNMWSDGLTIHKSDGSRVTGCRFVDNSDIDFISGGGRNATYPGNSIVQSRQACFGGLMLDYFGGATSGDFTGTVVSGNTIDCGKQLCDFGIELGPHPWYVSPNILGGTVSGNTVTGGKFDINAEGAGTNAAPVVVTGNTIGTVPRVGQFMCGPMGTTTFNVSPDSVVDLRGGQPPTASITVHLCP